MAADVADVASDDANVAADVADVADDVADVAADFAAETFSVTVAHDAAAVNCSITETVVEALF